MDPLSSPTAGANVSGPDFLRSFSLVSHGWYQLNWAEHLFRGSSNTLSTEISQTRSDVAKHRL